jgi:adenine-specific DNA-methyltransferase
MPTTEQLRNRLLTKLRELFQLNQPDLDFGFYRVMHAKAKEVEAFLDEDLLKIVDEAFGDSEADRLVELKALVAREIQTAKDYGVANPEDAPKVKEAQAAYRAARESGSAEAEVFDHLYRFFERYYDNGDFVSRRYYTRETEGQAAPFAIPYNGEEVKLHWANADQYYIKTAEAFSHFTVDLMQASEVRNALGELFRAAEGKEPEPKRVHFRVVDAAEGEHGNVKEGDKRFFILHAADPIGWNEQGELELRFEYRPDPEKSGQDNTWRKKRIDEAVEGVLAALEQAGEKEYLGLLRTPAPTEKEKNRPLLAKYLNKYTARNSMDYFIHKDLGNFLRRELDFYIKNEVMRLDDIENAEAPAVEAYLAKLKVLRKISHKLIDFLAQLEDFQKKLWLKKKFVVETNYGITLDRVPEALYAEIVANEAQREDWVRLFAIDEIEGDLEREGYSTPLTVAFLKQNQNLLLDTAFFDEDFKARLLASVEDLDGRCDGLLVHSENFQGLSSIQQLYVNQVKCITVDPPYNTGEDDFNYKDNYQHASWLSLLVDRIMLGGVMQTMDGALFCTLDDNEFANFKPLFNHHEIYSGFIANIIWKHTEQSKNDESNFSRQWNYVSCIGMPKLRKFLLPRTNEDNINYSNPDDDPNGAWRNGDVRSPNYRKTLCYNIKSPNGTVICHPANGWRWSEDTFLKKKATGEIIFNKDETNIIRKIYLKNQLGRTPENLWVGNRFGTTRSATKDLKDLFKISPFDTPKPKELIVNIISLFEKSEAYPVVLDYFAGSGTTGHAVINLNREDGGNRKYILIEMGEYFDTVLKPRIAKVVYSSDWKDGKPTTRNTGISHCFKYIRLESYEDTLNNLTFSEDETRERLLSKHPDLKEDYMLRYLLDVETRGSASLLNIDGFADPTAYKLRVKKPGSEEQVTRKVDLIETFNFLIGLRVEHLSAPQTFEANFEREKDPELPEDQETRLGVKGMSEVRGQRSAVGEEGFWFRKVEGWVPKDPSILDADTRSKNPENKEKVLIVWRKLSGDLERDNAVLDEWFRKNRISTQDFEFDTIYVNGSNTLPNLRQEGDSWKVRLIEEEFHKRMWEGGGI